MYKQADETGGRHCSNAAAAPASLLVLMRTAVVQRVQEAPEGCREGQADGREGGGWLLPSVASAAANCLNSMRASLASLSTRNCSNAVTPGYFADHSCSAEQLRGPHQIQPTAAHPVHGCRPRRLLRLLPSRPARRQQCSMTALRRRTPRCTTRTA